MARIHRAYQCYNKNLVSNHSPYVYSPIRCKKWKTYSITRLLFTSNRAAIIRNEILIRKLINAYPFYKLTNRFKFQIINSLNSRGARFAWHYCNSLGNWWSQEFGTILVQTLLFFKLPSHTMLHLLLTQYWRDTLFSLKTFFILTLQEPMH